MSKERRSIPSNTTNTEPHPIAYFPLIATGVQNTSPISSTELRRGFQTAHVPLSSHSSQFRMHQMHTSNPPSLSSSATGATASSGLGRSVDEKLQELVNHLNIKSNVKSSLNSVLVSSLKECIQQDYLAPSDAGEYAVREFPIIENPKKPRACRGSKPMYPYNELESERVAYRGYPVQGPHALKKSKRWKVQLTNSSLGAPTEPLPQFPQQELLGIYENQAYHGINRIGLTEEQVRWNSGKMYFHQDTQTPSSRLYPTSKSFYTSGYRRGSAVEVLKPFAESIYDTVINGASLDVPPHSTPVRLHQHKNLQ